MLTPRDFATPAWLDENKENQVPSAGGKGGLPMTPDTIPKAFHLRYQASSFATQAPKKLPPRGHPLQTLPRQQYNGGQAPTKVPAKPLSDYNTLNQLLDFNKPFNNFLSADLNTEPGPTIYEDQDHTMCNVKLFKDPPTPSALGFQDLTLLDHSESTVPDFTVKAVPRQNRTRVHIVPSMQWAE